jgi:small subunit ribosomal protein S1
MSENFAQLLEESFKNLEMREGTLVKGVVIGINDKYVIVDASLKSEALIPCEQFKDLNGELTVKVGDHIEVALDTVEDSTGETRLSREKAKRLEVWKRLEKACNNKETIQGVIVARVKGGFTVELDGIRAFLPASLLDTRPLKETAHLEGKPLDFKVVKIDPKRNNIVVSRRAVIEEEGSAERDILLQNLHEGQRIRGVVKNLTDYGAFIDLGGIDGLLHITDMAWKRIKHPSEMLQVGDEIDVMVLKFEREKNRVSLGIKQLGGDPWINFAERFPEGKKLKGLVTNIADYGCFVEISEGVEGLVHVSEMDWTNKNVNPNKVVQLGQEVEVMILDVDPERRRISLGLKQCISNPWASFAEKYKKGNQVTGVIKSITDFGVFIGIDGNIDGLIHLSDLSWTLSGEEAVKQYKKGDQVTAVVLAIDVERERVSLGIKQLENDPFSGFLTEHEKGSLLKGTVTNVDEKGATVDLNNGMQAYIKANDLSNERNNDARKLVKAGDEIEAAFINIDRKNNQILLSVRALHESDARDTKERLQNQNTDEPSAKLGDLLKEQLANRDDKKGE